MRGRRPQRGAPQRSQQRRRESGTRPGTAACGTAGRKGQQSDGDGSKKARLPATGQRGVVHPRQTWSALWFSLSPSLYFLRLARPDTCGGKIRDASASKQQVSSHGTTSSPLSSVTTPRAVFPIPPPLSTSPPLRTPLINTALSSDDIRLAAITSCAVVPCDVRWRRPPHRRDKAWGKTLRPRHCSNLGSLAGPRTADPGPFRTKVSQRSPSPRKNVLQAVRRRHADARRHGWSPGSFSRTWPHPSAGRWIGKNPFPHEWSHVSVWGVVGGRG
jgi:hypothetical protein